MESKDFQRATGGSVKKTAKIFTITTCFYLISMYGFSYATGNTFFFNLAGYSPSENQFKTGYGSGLGTTLMLTGNVVFSLEFKYGRFTVDPEEGKFLAGNLTLTPILVNVQYYFNPDAFFSPYVFGGISFVFTSFSAKTGEAEEEALITKQDPKDGIGFQGGIGAAFHVTERVAVFLEGYYFYRQTVVEATYLMGTSEPFDTDLSHASVCVGLKYYY